MVVELQMHDHEWAVPMADRRPEELDGTTGTSLNPQSQARRSQWLTTDRVEGRQRSGRFEWVCSCVSTFRVAFVLLVKETSQRLWRQCVN